MGKAEDIKGGAVEQENAGDEGKDGGLEGLKEVKRMERGSWRGKGWRGEKRRGEDAGVSML